MSWLDCLDIWVNTAPWIYNILCFTPFPVKKEWIHYKALITNLLYHFFKAYHGIVSFESIVRTIFWILYSFFYKIGVYEWYFADLYFINWPLNSFGNSNFFQRLMLIFGTHSKKNIIYCMQIDCITHFKIDIIKITPAIPIFISVLRYTVELNKLKLGVRFSIIWILTYIFYFNLATIIYFCKIIHACILYLFIKCRSWNSEFLPFRKMISDSII